MILSRRRFVVMTAVSGVAGISAAKAAVDETGFQSIGGIEQWVAIRGDDAANPAILYLHGGPGEAQSPFLKQFLPWQRDFTVVNWDQRGAGKTYGRNGASTPGMTTDRLVDDVCEVARHACARLSKKKVILAGQSWGSLLGVQAVKKRPDLFHAYVGTAQVVNIRESFLDLARYARQKATETGDRETLDALGKADALQGMARLGALRKASGKYIASVSDQPYVKMLDDFRATSPANRDAADWIEGGRFSGRTVGMSLAILDMRKMGLDMPVPFFIVQGRDDHITGLEPARAYAGDVSAPAKGFVAIEGGHYACFTNPDAFVGALREKVRPLAL